jgi:O-antigen/teichoic acid export membrane protein
VEKNIRDCLNIIFYIAMPVCFCIAVYAPGIYHVLYYTEDLATSSGVLAWNAVEGFLGTLVPVVSTIMMTVGYRKSLLIRLTIGAVAKAILIVPMVSLLGYPGAVLCSVLCNGYAAVFNLKEIHDKCNVRFWPTIRIALKLLLGLAVILIISSLLNLIGLDASKGSRIICLFKLALNGLCAVAGYGLFTWWLRIPQKVFHFRRRKA